MSRFSGDIEPRTRRILTLAACLPLLSLLLYVYQRQAALVAKFRFDDSYITLRYARQLSEHGVLSFNPDEHIDGYTSPAWTLLLTLVDRLGSDAAQVMLALSYACGFLAVLASILLAQALGTRWPVALVVPAVGVLYTPGFIVWSIPGMETPFVALCYAAVFAAMAMPSAAGANRQARWRVTCARAVLLAIAALARPEGALLAAALWAAELFLLRSEHGASATYRSMLRPYLALALLMLGLLVWRWRFYGYPLPNTFYAKSPTPALVARGTRDALHFVSQRGVGLAPILALALAARRASALACRTRIVLVVFALWFSCVLVVYARSGGDYPGFHRFYQPLVPASFAVLALAVSEFGALLREATRVRWLGRLATPATLALAAALLVDFSSRSLSEAFSKNAGMLASQTDLVESWARAGRALARTCAQGGCAREVRVATRAAGAVPHFSRAHRVYDTMALNNPDVAHHNPAVRDVPAHQKEATVAQVLRWKPNIIVGHPDLEARDRSGAPPAWFDNATIRAAGFAYRCIATEQAAEYFCFWQRPEARRGADRQSPHPIPSPTGEGNG